MATRINVQTIASTYLPPSRAWLLDNGHVVVEHVGRTEFESLAEAERRFTSTDFTVTDEPATP